MAEKQTKQQVIAFRVTRKRPFPVKIIAAQGFTIKPDKNIGLLDIRFEGAGQTSERIILDPIIIQGNLQMFKNYIARMPGEQDDAALKEEITASSTSFANIMHFSHMGVRAESIFGLVCLAEWVEAGAREGKEASREIPDLQSTDVVVVYSTKELQKKLLLEMVTLLTQTISGQ